MVNAFWLDRDPETTARWLVDRHVTSSVFECSMVLTTAVQQNGHEEREGLYFTHPDHPLTRWAARSIGNWRALRRYTREAHAEWRYRWDHDDDERHACWATVRSLDVDRVEALDWPGEPGDPPQVTGRWRADDYVDAYRLYYANEKRHLFHWSKDRSAPPWLGEYTVDGERDAEDDAVEDSYDRGDSTVDGERGDGDE
jgi:hypothetical protein